MYARCIEGEVQKEHEYAKWLYYILIGSLRGSMVHKSLSRSAHTGIRLLRSDWDRYNNMRKEKSKGTS